MWHNDRTYHPIAIAGPIILVHCHCGQLLPGLPSWYIVIVDSHCWAYHLGTLSLWTAIAGPTILVHCHCGQPLLGLPSWYIVIVDSHCWAYHLGTLSLWTSIAGPAILVHCQLTIEHRKVYKSSNELQSLAENLTWYQDSSPSDGCLGGMSYWPCCRKRPIIDSKLTLPMQGLECSGVI